MKLFDAIIIGTGQTGPSLAARFADAGKTVAIIERHKFGALVQIRDDTDEDDRQVNKEPPWRKPRLGFTARS